MNSSLVPVMQAAVPSVSADAAPALIMAASQPMSDATRSPTRSCSSFRWTYCFEQ